MKFSGTFGSISWERVSLDKLDRELRGILNAVPTPESPARSRGRYIRALSVVAKFLRSNGFHPAVVNDFNELVSALEELGDGSVRTFLIPTTSANRHVDPADLWRARAILVIAVDYLVSEAGISTRDAAKSIADVAGELIRFFSTTANDFPEAIRGWHKRLKNDSCSSAGAAKIFSERREYIEAEIADLIAEGKTPSAGLVVGGIVQVACVHAYQAATSKTISDVKKHLGAKRGRRRRAGI